MALTPRGRVSFPEVFKAKAMTNEKGEPTGDPRFSITLIFRPSEMEEDEKALFNAMVKAADDAARAKFGVGIKEEYKGVALKNPFRRGETKPDHYEPGDVFVRFSSKSRPNVVDAKVSPITEESDEMYAGCYARVSYSDPYAFDHTGNRGVSFSSLNNVQKMADGERFGAGRSKPEDDFAPVAGGDTAGVGASDDDIPF